ncbi:hypothetical protein ACWCPF_34850 [Streptomyces sp. NPDC001858]
MVARIAEAETEGWLGEVEGFQVSLAGAEKLSQLDRGHGQHTAVDLGIPTMRSDRCVVIDAPTKAGCRMDLSQDREQV